MVVSDDEVWSLNELEEFDHKFLHCLFDSLDSQAVDVGAQPNTTPDGSTFNHVPVQPVTNNSMGGSNDGPSASPKIFKHRKLDGISLRGILPEVSRFYLI